MRLLLFVIFIIAVLTLCLSSYQSNDGDNNTNTITKTYNKENMISNTAFVIRSHKPTTMALQRISKWIYNMRDNIDVWFSLDISKTDRYVYVVMRHMELAGLQLNKDYYIHTYTIKDIKKKFSHIDELINICDYIDDSTFLWGFHAEPIILWYLHTNNKYDYVWICEDDVEYSGNFYNLIEEYNTIADLTTAAEIDIQDSWMECHTKNLEEIPYKCPEHIQRLSRKLLMLINELLEQKISAWSEKFTIYVAREYGLNIEYLHDVHIGSRYSWDEFITESQWNEILQNPKNRNKLWHALKF